MRTIPKTERSYYVLTALLLRQERLDIERYRAACYELEAKRYRDRLSAAMAYIDEQRRLAKRTPWQRFCDWVRVYIL